MSHPRTARRAPRPVAVQCGTHDKKWEFEGKHPVVRRLWNAVAEHFTLDDSFNESYPGFKAMVRSLATPCVVLYDARKSKQAFHAAVRPESGSKSDSDRVPSTETPPVGDRVQKRNWGVDGQWQEFVRSFVGTIEFLCTLDWHVDEHWTVVKYHVAVLEQRAVGDAGCGSGHVLLAPPASMAGMRPLFCGIISRWLNRTVARCKPGRNNTLKGCRSALGICASFLLCKRGWARASEFTLAKSVRSHQANLTAVKAPLDFMTVNHIRKAVQEIVRPVDVYTSVKISRHASNESSRQKGGVFAQVAGAGITASELANPDGVVQSEGHLHPKGSLKSIAALSARFKKDVFVRCQQKIIEMEAQKVKRYVSARFIAEPGKFRAISVGDGYLNTFLTPIQAKLIDFWKESPMSTMKAGWERRVETFALPADAKHEGWVWNSIDYEAATDKLNLESSLTAIAEVERILRIEVPHDLGGTTIEYSDILRDVAEKDVHLFAGISPEINQTNGQLMGHPLSFPLLCMINYAGVLKCLSQGMKLGLLDSDDVELIKSMIIINGDDLMFPCPPELVSIFEQCALDVGLTPSLGKSYTSKYFAMVNNVQFLMTPGGNQQFGYVNQKLIYNFSLKSGEEKDSPFEIGTAFNKMFDLCPESLAFLPDGLMNRSKLPVGGFVPNFFFPSHLGGYGVDIKYAQSKPGASRLQRQVAAAATEGVLNSFIIRQRGALKAADKELGRLLSRLPKPIARTFPNSAQYEGTREEWVSSDGVNGEFVSRKDQYSSWVGLFESIKTPLEDMTEAQRKKIRSGEKEESTRQSDIRVLRETIKDVRPMKLSKCLEGKRDWLYPVLPRAESGLTVLYDPSFRSDSGKWSRAQITMDEVSLNPIRRRGVNLHNPVVREEDLRFDFFSLADCPEWSDPIFQDRLAVAGELQEEDETVFPARVPSSLVVYSGPKGMDAEELDEFFGRNSQVQSD